MPDIDSHLDCILDFESNQECSSLKINNFRPWPFIRIQVAGKLMDHNRLLNSYVSSRKRGFSFGQKTPWVLQAGFRSIRSAIFSLLDWKKNQFPRKNFKVVLLGDGLSHTKVHGLWYENICDPLVEILNSAGIDTLLMLRSDKLRTPRYSSSIFIVSLIDAATWHGKRHPVSSPELLTLLQKLTDHLSSHGYSQIFSTAEICSGLSSLIWLSNAFEKLFTHNNTKAVLSVDYYSIPGMALTLAANRKGIDTFDIQHGVQGRHHPAYGRWDHVPPDGYELLPKFFWCWSEHEVSNIKAWSKNSPEHHIPLVGGQLLQQRWNLLDPKTRNLELQTMKKQAESYKNTGLVSLSGLESDADMKLIFECIEKMKDRVFWWIRCHPSRTSHLVEINSILSAHSIKNADASTATNLPLFALLSVVDVHLSAYSSVILDAESWGVPSIMFHPASKEMFKEQLSRGVAEFKTDSDSIHQSVEAIISSPKNPITSKPDCLNEKPNAALSKLLAILS